MPEAVFDKNTKLFEKHFKESIEKRGSRSILENAEELLYESHLASFLDLFKVNPGAEIPKHVAVRALVALDRETRGLRHNSTQIGANLSQIAKVRALQKIASTDDMFEIMQGLLDTHCRKGNA